MQTMSNTIREQIILAYMTRLASWTTANGFNYSCGSTAQRAVQHIEFDDLPACVLWPQVEEVTQQYGQNVCEMIVKIEALAEVGTTNPSIIQEKLLGDCIKIMTDPSVVVTALIDDITYTGGGPAGINKDEEKVAAITANFTIKYETLTGNPFSR
jgi:hypothetical protein